MATAKERDATERARLRRQVVPTRGRWSCAAAVEQVTPHRLADKSAMMSTLNVAGAGRCSRIGDGWIGGCWPHAGAGCLLVAASGRRRDGRLRSTRTELSAYNVHFAAASVTADVRTLWQTSGNAKRRAN